MMRKRRQLARLPNALLLFVERNSRKRGPPNYSLACRPVLTQLLAPKTTRENGEKFSALNTPTASANPWPSPSLRQCCYSYGLSCLTDRSDRYKNLLLTANLNSLTCSGKKAELTNSCIQRGNTWD